MTATIVGVGTAALSAASITPGYPAAYTPVLNDVALTVASCEGLTAPGAYTLPSGWGHVTGSPVLQGTNVRLWVIWQRLAGGETAPALGDSGDHNIGAMMILRGCPTVGNPWNVAGAAVEAVSDTSAAWPGATTTADDCLILEIIATSADSTTAPLGATPLTNANYSAITTRINAGSATGVGGSIGVVSGIQATKGATGSSAGTLQVAGLKALMTVAFPNPGGLFNWYSRPNRPARMLPSHQPNA